MKYLIGFVLLVQSFTLIYASQRINEMRAIIDIQNETILQYSELSSTQDEIIKLQDEIINVSK